jgi:hypothetical protein
VTVGFVGTERYDAARHDITGFMIILATNAAVRAHARCPAPKSRLAPAQAKTRCVVEVLHELDPVALGDGAELHLNLETVLANDHMLRSVAIPARPFGHLVIDVNDLP